MLSSTPVDGLPTLVIDLLAAFYDDNVRLPESQRLLADCIFHLKRLSQYAPVVVSAKPPASLCAEKRVLVDTLQAAADGSWHLEALPAPKMPTLWGKEI
ncbi:MAG: hypothetical protein J7K66_06435 [Anaerolineaceae bacterium]|nr:hypothetical protein [Anaerolineaceae bacterium]